MIAIFQFHLKVEPMFPECFGLYTIIQTDNHFRATKCENKAYTHQTDCTQQYAKILGFYHIKPALKNQAHPKLGWRRQSFAKVGSWGKKLPISPS